MGDFIGQTIHGYEIREQIGAGGYGAVYKAYETSVNRDVAVKVILPEHANKSEFAQRFEAEARLVAQLEHPHIVPLYAYWRDDAGAFLVMRYVKGGSLRDVLQTQSAVSLAQTARLLNHITGALEVAHSAGVIHRDLKPGNILLDERGNAYLTDFGIAKQLDDDARITGTDSIVGTFAYLAPEQVQGESVSPQTDTYALGIMLYEMLVGEHPFADTPIMMMVTKHLQEPVPPITENRPDLPGYIDHVIQKATAKDPTDRYTDALTMAVDFRRAANFTVADTLQMSAVTQEDFHTTDRELPDTPNVFISYRRQPSATLAQLVHLELEKRGISSFVDVRNIQEVGHFPEHLRQAVREANYFVCLLAETTLESEWVREEIRYAHSLDKTLIPVFQESFQIPEGQPDHIHALLHAQGIQLLEQRGLYMEEALAKLARMIRPSTPAVSVSRAYPEYTPPARKELKRKTPEQRNRHAMIQNVRTYWVEGVLENSLHGAAMIELGMKQETDTVDNPWDTLLRRPDSPDETLPPGTRILDVFDRLNGKLLILGDPGSGKTITLLELARDLLFRAEVDDAHPIPVVFNLSSWGERRKPLEEWLTDELSGKYQVPKKVAGEWVESDTLLLLLDGLDEVVVEHRETCVQAINTYREEHGFVDVVVCSRIRDYEALTNQLKLNGAIVIQPLNETQVDVYLASLGPEMNNVRAMLTEDEMLREMSRSPLMLSITALAYRGVSAEHLPELDTPEAQRKHLFEVYIQRMFERRMGERPYTQEKSICYLSWLARKMVEHGQSVFQIENLQPSWLVTEHRQSFHRMVYLVNVGAMILVYWGAGVLWASGLDLPLVVFSFLYALGGAVTGWIFAGNRWQSRPFHLLVGLANGVAFGVSAGIKYDPAFGLFIGLIATSQGSLFSYVHGQFLSERGGDQDNIAVVEILRFSWQQINWWHVLALITSGSIFLVMIIAIVFQQQTLDVSRLFLGWVFAFVFSLPLFVYQSGLTSGEVEMRSSPNQGVRASLRNAIRIALLNVLWAFSVATALAIFGLSPSAIVSIVAGLAIFLAYINWPTHGGINVYQHVALRRVLERDGFIPRNYAKFLDYAASLILLRKVGGGYIFIHRYLLEYFAELETGE